MNSAFVELAISFNCDIKRKAIIVKSTRNSVSMQSNKMRLSKMLKALGNPIRFQIMETLVERQGCITNDIVATTSLAQSTVSQHLKVLREAGLIHGDINGLATCYFY